MRRILLVDDATTIRMYHRKILEGAGYSVETAVNGVDALERALQEPFSLFLVDVNMPKLDGYGFLHELRARDLKQTPAIMITTESEAQDQARAAAVGANAFVVKPVKPDDLLLYTKLLMGTSAS